MNTKNKIYQDYEGLKILKAARYNGRWYVIISNHGKFPCAYVQLKADDACDEDSLMELDVHGGVTFNNTLIHLAKYKDNAWMPRCYLNYNYVGWDYGHCEDYINNEMYYPKGEHDIVHTLTELTEDCEYAINQLNNARLKRQDK